MEQKGPRPYAAHISEDRQRVQTIKDHLLGTAEFARAFAEAFGAGDLAYQCGLLHDIGKYTPEFQKRIWENGDAVDHSSAGAQAVLPLCGTLGAYAIAGHHAGLMDGGSRADPTDRGTLCARLNKKLEESDFAAYRNDVSPQKPGFTPPKLLGKGGFTVSFFIRMLFSCLVDADFLDTERFMTGGTVQRPRRQSVKELSERLDAYVQPWWNTDNELNRKRCKILRICMNTGDSAEKGLFTLTVPTGGGKTISSLAFALHHAKEKKMDRVIYVIPYCSIIDQTVDVFCDAVGAENVLAHYSGANYADRDGNTTPRQQAMRLATENWDMPIVVTTAVQFFESLFSNRTSACRKLHNMANSVIVFDEAQTLPLPYLKPCLHAIAELIVNCGSSCVLCTATQPALGPLFHEFAPSLTAREICPGTEQLYRFFRRVTYRQAGSLTDEELAERLNAQNQVLCIVTTRRQAQNVYRLLTKEGSFHLSTLMTPNHRRSVLKTIRERLSHGLPCRVVSTSLIEAGVNVDFPTVYRACAGLDSEIQAAGRCNRENGHPAGESIVWIFRPEEKYSAHIPTAISLPAKTAEEVTRGKEEIDVPEVIRAYFTELYSLNGPGLDFQHVVDQFESDSAMHGLFPFKTVAEKFHLIEQSTRAVLIPRDKESRELAARLLGGEVPNREMFRRMGPCCVNIYEQHFKKLLPSLNVISDSVAVLASAPLYSEETGLSMDDEGGFGFFG